MYHHVKKLMYSVKVGEPDPRFGRMLLEQFGGVNGELAAAMQYTIQGYNCEDPGLKDLFMDIGTEELSHLEVIGALTRMHLKSIKTDRDAALAEPFLSLACGGYINIVNSQGIGWTANYLKITGQPEVDLRNNIAAEGRAKMTYENLLKFCDDLDSKDALQFLMTREITHMKAFMLALESLGKQPLEVGTMAPTPGLVDQYFNDSTGEGEHGAVDMKGPWNDDKAFHRVDNPAFNPQQIKVDGGNGAARAPRR